MIFDMQLEIYRYINMYRFFLIFSHNKFINYKKKKTRKKITFGLAFRLVHLSFKYIKTSAKNIPI